MIGIMICIEAARRRSHGVNTIMLAPSQRSSARPLQGCVSLLALLLLLVVVSVLVQLV